MARADGIVTGYDQVGGCTLRQAYYRLVVEGLIPHTAPTYRRLSARLAQARREERFPDLIGAVAPQLGIQERSACRYFDPAGLAAKYRVGASPEGSVAASGGENPPGRPVTDRRVTWPGRPLGP